MTFKNKVDLENVMHVYYLGSEASNEMKIIEKVIVYGGLCAAVVGLRILVNSLNFDIFL